ncbi:hypothetical protein Gotur_033710 [Gossypium turneri]
MRIVKKVIRLKSGNNKDLPCLNHREGSVYFAALPWGCWSLTETLKWLRRIQIEWLRGGVIRWRDLRRDFRRKSREVLCCRFQILITTETIPFLSSSLFLFPNISDDCCCFSLANSLFFLPSLCRFCSYYFLPISVPVFPLFGLPKNITLLKKPTAFPVSTILIIILYLPISLTLRSGYSSHVTVEDDDDNDDHHDDDDDKDEDDVEASNQASSVFVLNLIDFDLVWTLF